MKNLMIVAFLFLPFSSYASSGLKSSGQDLNCGATLEAWTKFYTCDTDYGPSDTCFDDFGSVIISLNPLKGDLVSGLAGVVSPTSIRIEDQSKSLDQVIINIAKDLHLKGLVSYKNKLMTMTLKTSLGEKTSMVSKDFSVGHYGAYSLVFIDNYFDKSTSLNLRIILNCAAGTK